MGTLSVSGSVSSVCQAAARKYGCCQGPYDAASAVHTHTPTGREIDSKVARMRRQRGVNCPYREDADAQRELRENRKELTSR